uniref:Helicase n=1 Tax=viral metagenome TaxID=1070528 RepID=A0A6C0H974_9ZZZZ
MESFDKLNLNSELLKGVYLYGFLKPSKIQIEGIEAINTKQDCILQSQSGTGKTATYLLGVINNMNINNISIIIVPTRELAEQVYNVAISLSKYTNFKIHKCIGGTNINETRNNMKISNLIIGTIGRINHMIEENKIQINKLNILIFDEADNLLGDNNLDNINNIINKVDRKNIEQNINSNKNNIQFILISATIPLHIFTFSKKYMNNPIQILVNNENIITDLISQFYINVEIEDQKFDTLLDLYSLVSTFQAIIFANTIAKVEYIENKLIENNFTASLIHSNMAQTERDTILLNFREGYTRILLTTDLLSRGIDIPQVNMVINYDIPVTHETYVHRIGRCGRFDKKGIAITLVKLKDTVDIKLFNKLKYYYKININEMPMDINSYL